MADGATHDLINHLLYFGLLIFADIDIYTYIARLEAICKGTQASFADLFLRQEGY